MSQSSCVIECGNALTYVKGKGTSHAGLAKTIEDCIELCKLRESFENRGSKLFDKVKELCSEACIRCSTECEAAKDDQLKKCIETCGSCSDECKN
jgi:hypothetical protein